MMKDNKSPLAHVGLIITLVSVALMCIDFHYNVEPLGGIGSVGVLLGFSLSLLALIHMKHIGNFKG